MTSPTRPNVTIETAIAEARDWLATDNGDDPRLTDDLETALAAFDRAIDAGDLDGALSACEDIAYDWASGDRSGFRDFRILVIAG